MKHVPFHVRYGLVILAVAGATLLRSALHGLFEEGFTFITFYPAVALVAMFLGARAGVAATVLSALTVDYLLMPPLYTLTIADPGQIVALGLFTAAGLLMCWMGERLDQSRRREAEAAERERSREELVRTAAEVARQKELLAVTLASIGDAVIVTDAQGHISFLNSEAERLTGWTSGDAAGQPLPTVFRIVNEQTRQPVESPVDKVLRLGTVVGLANHTILIARDGREIPIDDSGAPIRQGQGAVQGVVLVFRDFTEPKQAGRYREMTLKTLQVLNRAQPREDAVKGILLAIRESTGVEAIGIRLHHGDDYPYYQTSGFSDDFVEMERSLCTHDPDGQIALDAAGHPILDCMCGNVIQGRTDPSKPFFTPGGSFWTNCTTQLLATTTEADRQSRTRNRCNGEGFESVALIPLRSNEKIIGLLQLNDHRKGMFTLDMIQVLEGVGASVGVALERQRAEEALRESDARYRSLFENMAEGLAHCQMLYKDGQPEDFVYLDVNVAFERLTGIKGVVGKKVTEVIPGIRESSPELLEIYGRVASTGRPESFETFVPALSTWFSVSAYSPGEGRFVAVFDNITERKRLEEQFRQAQKMEAIGQLAGGVAHDFRNQLTIIKGFAEMLLRRSLVREEGKDNIQEILKAADRSALLTGQLLAFSRKQTLEPQRVDLSGVIADVSRGLRRMIGEDVQLQIIPCSAPCMVEIDPGQLQQALFNLAANARDAMPKGGRLTIETSRMVPGENFLKRYPDARSVPYAAVAVRDSGCGIDEATRGRLFEPFFTTKEVGQGTGLGLAMVYGFVKQSGGVIAVESELGKGSTFTLYFPECQGDSQEGTRQASVGKGLPGGTETLLVVEDEEAVRRMLVESLRESGYTVLEAGSATRALEVISQAADRIDLVITDVVMPGGSGVELVQELAERRPDMSVLYMSGYPKNELTKRGAVIDPGHIVAKPCDYEVLVTKVRQVLDMAGRNAGRTGRGGLNNPAKERNR